MLLVEYLAQWLESIRPMLRPVTYEAYTVYINRHMIPYFLPFGYSLENVTPMQIQQYVNTKLQGGRLDGHKGGLSVVSVRKHLNILRQSSCRCNPLWIYTKQSCKVCPFTAQSRYTLKALCFLIFRGSNERIERS